MINLPSITIGGVEMPEVKGVRGSVVRLINDWHVEGMLPDGRVFYVDVRAGFEFDGASIPRFLWRVCGHPLEAPRIAAALAHDWIYSSKACDRRDADQIYRAICKKVGIPALCYGTEYAVLRLCGWVAWNGHTMNDRTFALTHGVLELENRKVNTK